MGSASWCGSLARISVHTNQPPLKSLHADDSLIGSKFDKYGKLSDQELINSLRPGQQGSLKARPDGTIVDGHHRIKILRDRGVDVDSLPREIIPKDEIPDTL
jgi:ParB-like chromosome segregation protein Spo0J